MAAGLSNGETAARWIVSEATVKTHIFYIFAKTGNRDRASNRLRPSLWLPPSRLVPDRSIAEPFVRQQDRNGQR